MGSSFWSIIQPAPATPLTLVQSLAAQASEPQNWGAGKTQIQKSFIAAWVFSNGTVPMTNTRLDDLWSAGSDYPPPAKSGENGADYLNRVVGGGWHPSKGDWTAQVANAAEQIGGAAFNLITPVLAGAADDLVPGSGQLIRNVNSGIQKGLSADEAALNATSSAPASLLPDPPVTKGKKPVMMIIAPLRAKLAAPAAHPTSVASSLAPGAPPPTPPPAKWYQKTIVTIKGHPLTTGEAGVGAALLAGAAKLAGWL